MSDRQRQEHRRHRVTGDDRLDVEPRHAVVVDVEPAVDARGRPRQHEQQRGDVQRQVAAVVQSDPGQVNAVTAPSAPASPANAPNCMAHFVGVNVQQQQADRGGADQPPRRPAGHAGYPAAPQQHDQHAEQAQHHDQHRESPRHRTLGVAFHREEVVAQEVLVPGDRRADLVLDPRRLGDGGQRLATGTPR